MNKWQRILTIAGGLSLMVLLVCNMTTALLTDIEQEDRLFLIDATTVDIALYVEGLEDETTVDPGEVFYIKPWISNDGSGDIYAFIEIDIPLINDVPIFSYEASAPWELLISDVRDGYKTDIYSYGGPSAIGAGTSLETQPLMETATFNNVKSDSDDTLTMSIKAYAVTVEGFTGDIGDPIDVWNTTVEAANSGQ